MSESRTRNKTGPVMWALLEHLAINGPMYPTLASRQLRLGRTSVWKAAVKWHERGALSICPPESEGARQNYAITFLGWGLLFDHLTPLGEWTDKLAHQRAQDIDEAFKCILLEARADSPTLPQAVPSSAAGASATSRLAPGPSSDC